MIEQVETKQEHALLQCVLKITDSIMSLPGHPARNNNTAQSPRYNIDFHRIELRNEIF